MLNLNVNVRPLCALSSRAMLAGLRLSVWSARRIDRRVTDQVNAQQGAAADAGRYNKALLAKDALSAINAAVNEARSLHYSRTLPWLDDGARLLPAKAHLDYSRELARIKCDFDVAVDEFVATYPSYVADAQRRLGAMFNPEDYPAPDQVRGKFAFASRLLPVPDAADFRVDVGDAAAAEIKAQIEQATQDALRAATRDVWERIAEVVGRMAERLRAYQPPQRPGDRVEGIFRDSLVENVRDLCALLPSLNLTGDADLARIADAMQRDLCAHDADELRQWDQAREDTAARAEAILADVRDFLA